MNSGQMRRRRLPGGAWSWAVSIAVAGVFMVFTLAACASQAGDTGPAATPIQQSEDGAGEADGQQLAQERAATALAKKLEVAVADLIVVSVTPMSWSDAGLGCPQPDTAYAQVITPGYLALFRDSGGKEYKVHTNNNGSAVIVCDK